MPETLDKLLAEGKDVDGLFNTTQVDKLISILDDVRQRAAA